MLFRDAVSQLRASGKIDAFASQCVRFYGSKV